MAVTISELYSGGRSVCSHWDNVHKAWETRRPQGYIKQRNFATSSLSHTSPSFSYVFVIRLVPFVLTLAIIEEIIPLIVMYAPGMLPSTCVLPSQRARIDTKRHSRQRESYEIMRELPVLGEYSLEEVTLDTFTRNDLTLLCKYVYSRISMNPDH